MDPIQPREISVVEPIGAAFEKTKQILFQPFDIGKWFRNTEFAFYLKKDYNEFKIEQDEVFTYLRFHTDEKINFKQFRPTQRISELIADGFACNQIWQPLRKLENYYKIFKNKRLALKEIKENLL